MRRTALAVLLLAGACRPTPLEPTAGELLAAAIDEIRHGQLSEALTLADRGFAAAPADPALPLAPQLRLLRAEIFLLQRQSVQALPLLAEPLPDLPALAVPRAKQRALEGQVQIGQGELARAIPTLDEAARLARAAGDLGIELDARNLKGQAQLRLAQWAEGDRTLAAVAADAARAGSDYHLALAVINRGMAHLERDRFDQALPYFERATALERVTMRIRAVALTNAGLCHTRLGDFDRGIALQQRAVAAHATSAPIFLQQALGELGTTYYLKGDVPQAISHLTRALDVASVAAANGRADARLEEDAAVWMVNLADMHARLQAWDRAEELNRRARAINLRLGQSERSRGLSERVVYTTLNDARIAAGRGHADRAAALYREILVRPGSNPFMASQAHAGLAELALATGRRPEALPHFDAALRVVERAQDDLAQTEYKLPYLTRLIDLYGRYIDTLMTDGRVDRALEVADSSRARVLAERHGLRPAAKRSAAAFKRLAATSGSTLLLYWVGTPRSYGWAITATEIRAVTLPGTSAIDALARSHQQMIVQSVASPLPLQATPGDKLYALAIAPFADLLGEGRRVIIFPDGPLSRVNFETLPVDGQPRHFWIDDVEVVVAPSLATLLGAGRSRAPLPRSLLLIGDPEASDPAFPKLKYAQAELFAVAAAFPSARQVLYRGAGASPRAFHAARPERFALIHFTAHATANVESPLDSAVILSPDADGYKLYARDVATHRLDADLVTISACRSAGDRTFSGEGLVGFAWAFLRAGARRVLAGLWDVDDRSTTTIMTAVYAGLARGERPEAALRLAKLAMIRRGGAEAKPYYWGPFQLIVAAR